MQFMCEQSGHADHLITGNLVFAFEPALELIAGVLYKLDPDTGQLWRMLDDGPFLVSTGVKEERTGEH